LEECQKLFLEGKFKKLGLSNYASWQVIDACYVCKINGLVTPTINQGMYNAITRNVEYELFPALRSVGMAFYTYNPLAGGLLTGRYERLNVYPQTGRFAIMPLYKERYWKEGYFYAIDQLATTCKAFEIDMTSAALRWLVCHSMLGDLQGNSLIVGASSVQQIEMNLQSLLQGPLPAEVVDCFDHCWQQMKGESPAYFRS
jgi:aflatoxin B1 aldehyde reductase